jgi:hypothetical protein
VLPGGELKQDRRDETEVATSSRSHWRGTVTSAPNRIRIPEPKAHRPGK